MKALSTLACVVVFLCVACKGTERKIQKEKETLITQSSSKVECVENEQGNYLLCRTSVDKSDPLKVNYHIKFAVIDKSTGNTIYEGSVVGGYVQWYSPSQIEFYSPPGIMPEGRSINDYIKIYDLDAGEISPKSKIRPQH